MGEALERIEDEMFCLGEAIEYLGRVRGCEDLVGELEDKVRVLAVEREEAERQESARIYREMAAERREYYRSVL